METHDPNVLNFITAQERMGGSEDLGELWIVADYYERGYIFFIL
jgi:hypothetical protein